MWPFDDYKQGFNYNMPPEKRARHPESKTWDEARSQTKKSECKCGKSDEVLAELIKLFSSFIREIHKMSDASVALKADIAALAGKVDELIARPPTEVIVPDPATEADVADASVAVKAMADKIDAALAPAA